VATFEVVLRLSLAVVYGVAGIGKLLSPQSTDLLIETFRLSPRLRPAVSASVVATNSAGQIVTMDIPVSPVLPSRAAVRGVSVDAGAQSAIVSGHAYDELRPKSNACPEPERTAVSAEVASCEEVCSAALALMIGVLTPRGERIQRGHREGQHNLNGREDHCSTLVCTVKLEGCRNYTGTCYDLDSVCERNCPGGLKHPLAHCDVYLTRLGKKIKTSSLLPGP